jgi:hypothetical protein
MYVQDGFLHFRALTHDALKAYTILESTTDSIFLHMTMSEYPNPYWGNLLKSNSNGTYFGLSLENVNRDERGLVDFEKMIGLDGIAVVNIVANTEEAAITGYKSLQTRITHNDGAFERFDWICMQAESSYRKHLEAAHAPQLGFHEAKV